MLYLFNRITESIQETVGRKYLPRGPHVGQPCHRSSPGIKRPGRKSAGYSGCTAVGSGNLNSMDCAVGKLPKCEVTTLQLTGDLRMRVLAVRFKRT